MICTFPKSEKPIYRGRPVKNANEIYTNESQITYPPKSTSTKLNRASSGKFQVLYGSVTTEEIKNPIVTPIFEIGSYTDGELIALGKWDVHTDFTIAVLGLHSEIAKSNSMARTFKEKLTGMTKDLKDAGEMLELVSQFMSIEFSKEVKDGDEWQHLISAAYGDAIFELGLSGILYPSVKTEGQAFNIAMQKEAVDKFTKLTIAGIAKCKLIEGSNFYFPYLNSPTIIDGKFRWEDPPRKEVVGEVEERMIRENMIRNGGKFKN